jgi:hypothetical protein
MALNGRMDIGKIWNEAVEAYFQVLFQALPGGIERERKEMKMSG